MRAGRAGAPARCIETEVEGGGWGGFSLARSSRSLAHRELQLDAAAALQRQAHLLVRAHHGWVPHLWRQ